MYNASNTYYYDASLDIWVASVQIHTSDGSAKTLCRLCLTWRRLKL